MTHPLPSQDAWTRARNRYVQDLDQEERRRYQNAKVNDIVSDAREVEGQHRQGSTSLSVVEKLQPLLVAIEQYGRALDVYLDILEADFGFQLAREFGKFFDKLLDMLTQIGDVLPRFKIFERLFGRHELVVEALSDVYVDIISFCADTKGVFRKGKRSFVTNLKIFSKLVWKPFELQFGKVMASFRQHTKNVESSAGLSHMIEAADAREMTRDCQMQLQRAYNEDRRQRVLDSLTCVQYEQKHRKLQSLRQEGTCEWLITNIMYLEWKDAHSFAVLCIQGIPGSGKSVLVSHVIDDLHRSASPAAPNFVYYYFDFANHQTLQINQFQGCLIKQLLLKGLLDPEIEDRVYALSQNGMKIPDDAQLKPLLSSAIGILPDLTLVVDGLDECDRKTYDYVLKFLSDLKVINNIPLKILVTCRNDEEMLQSMAPYSRVELSLKALKADLQSYISRSIKTKIESKELRIRNPTLEREIITELVDKSQGMFL